MRRYHRFIWRDLVDITVIEPKQRHFVWLSFYVNKRLRNAHLAHELIVFVVEKLKGTHHIHPPRQLKTFHQAARKWGWRKAGTSPFFDDCIAFVTESGRASTNLYPLLDALLTHKIQNRMPHSRTFVTQQEARETAALITAKDSLIYLDSL